MKFKTTKKAIKDNYNTILSLGYCSIQNLLTNQEPMAYSAGSNGWACDYYKVGNVVISTGYAPIGQGVDYEVVRRYEEKAQTIMCDYIRPWEARTNEVDKLLNQFVEEVTA